MFDLLFNCLSPVYTFSFRDEDMQSLASLMSMKQADIGNLDDFEEENEEDEENRVNQEEKAAKITGEEEEKERRGLRSWVYCKRVDRRIKQSQFLFCAPLCLLQAENLRQRDVKQMS